MKKSFFIVLLAIVSGFGGAYFFNLTQDTENTANTNSIFQPVGLANFAEKTDMYPNFVNASAVVTPTVVHIKSKKGAASRSNIPYDPWRDFFGGGAPQQREQVSSGSGVIVSNEGYVLTNNHVVSGAEEIEITLHDKRSFKATLVGTDPNTDIAVLKIKGDNLPVIAFGNSDDVMVGEWVLAVGNPFNLTSTVTAGIVSAKGRDINIIGGASKIESFIQTDAAVNPGNSGGALVNTRGELIGINTAIASETGNYAGYSFAVPVNLAKKIFMDLTEYGFVQRGFLGVQIIDVNQELAQKEGLKVSNGVYVADFSLNSSAKDAGIKKGDVIVEIDGKAVSSRPRLQEIVSSKRPGQAVAITVDRAGERKSYSVILKDEAGNAKLMEKDETNLVADLGAHFSEITKADAQEYGVDAGIKIVSLNNGKLKLSGAKVGFVITRIQSEKVKTVSDIKRILSSQDKDAAILIEGVYPGGKRAYYGVGQ